MRTSTYILPLLALLSPFLPRVMAESGVLQTDSVTYCSESKAVNVEQFEIAYHRYNRSVTFSFSLQAVESNLNVSANLYLNAYGMDIVNQTIPLCSLFEGVICPLPTNNFTGFGTYPIPSEYTSKVPSIAYTVPDLEAFAQLQLIRESGAIAACLQATLSNGESTKQIGVAIGTAVFTLVALLVGLSHNALVNSPSPAQYRWFDILYLYQTAAATGFLHLNYPLVYTKFVQNFAWAMALFHSGAMQSSINKLREKTGGHVEHQLDTNNGTTSYINRKLSPYNVRSVVDVNSFESPRALRSFIDASPALNLDKRAFIASAVPQTNSSEVNTGIPVYTNDVGIPDANALDTIFFFFLAFAAIAIAFHVVMFLVVFVAERSGARWARRLRQMWWGFCAGNALRLCLIFFLPLWIFGFWQFTIGDSKLSIFFAVLSILLTLAPLATIFLFSVLRSNRVSSTAPTISRLYTSYRWFHSVGVLYRPYRQKYHFFWFAPLILAMIARAGFIAFGSGNVWAQVIGNIVVEAIVFVCIIALRPHKDRKGDWLGWFLSFCRMAAFGLLIAFIPSMNVKPITRTIIGFVIIVLFGVPTILLLLGLFWNLGYGYWWRRHTHKIEDGLEVDRSLASQDEDRDRVDMRQSVDANDFVTGPSAYASRSRMDLDGPSRRTSIMEPVNTNYDPGSQRSSRYLNINARGSGAPNSPPGSTPISPTTLSSPLDPYNQRNSVPPPVPAKTAYERAAAGQHDRYGQYGNYGQYGQNGGGISRPSSRGTMGSRISDYQTPMSGVEYHTPMSMPPGAAGPQRYSGNGGEYFERR